ncbi:MAG: aminotransferase class V-fold PLP-dependent enzyme [Gemmatimonadetes bacterium]|nr:aminotransferase class V-fold PLP-dependent enzyme [Gemmatimonadota bacterium]
MLIDPSEFIGTQGITHLCTGGESPMLKTHGDAVNRFFEDKLLGEEGRRRLEVVSTGCKEKVGRLFGVPADDIAFLTSTSEAINLLVYGLEWNSGDNVVVADVEFPSDVLPWTLLKDRGVELRIVENANWRTELEDLDKAIDENTRVVNVSHVSYFTGQRLPLPELAEIVHRKNALLCLDVTHSAGAVPVEAQYADFVVSSCYKWLMAVHGVGIFYWNRQRVPELNPPFVGWHTPAYLPDWKDPSAYIPRKDASRFTPGNETWIGVYILDNALDCLLGIGIDRIEEHVLRLSTRVWDGLAEMGWEVITPRAAAERAGNVCFTAADVDAVTHALEDRNVLIFGAYGGVGRARVSTHFFNNDRDVDRFLEVMREIPVTRPESTPGRDFSKAAGVAAEDQG